MQLVEVQFKHVALKSHLRHLLSLFFFQVENFVKSVRNNARCLTCALDCVSLSRASLAVGKHTNIEAIKCRLHQVSRIFEDLCL